MMKKLILLTSVLTVSAQAAVTVPATASFTSGTTISSSQMNSNFTNIQNSFTELNGILPATTCSAGQYLFFNGTSMICQTASIIDATKLPLSGGTMTGPLVMSGNSINMGGAVITNIGTPTVNTHSATKGYVDSAITTSAATLLPLSGGAMTGTLNMNSQRIQNLPTPSLGNDAANKAYVDTASSQKLSLVGGTMAGNINMNFNFVENLPTPTNNAHAATKAYVDNLVSFTDCPSPNRCNVNGEVRVGTIAAQGAKLSAFTEALPGADYRAVKGTLNTTANSMNKFSGAEFIINSAHDVQSSHGIITGVNHTLGVATAGTTGLTIKNSITGGTVGYNKGIFIDMFPTSVATNNAGLHISTQGTEIAGDWAIRVDGQGKSFFGGRIGIKQINPTEELDVTGDMNLTGCVYVNGSPSATGNCPSDQRLKKNIKPFELGLDLVENIHPKRYEYNGLAETRAGISQVGFIAQDLQKLAPEFVKKEMMKLRPSDAKETEILKIDYGKFTYVLFNAVRELSAKVKGLEASRTIASEKDSEIAELKKENAMMKSYLCAKDKTAPFCH